MLNFIFRAILKRLDRIEEGIYRVHRFLQAMEAKLMNANEQITQFLNELNEYTNQLAQGQAAQTAKLTEVSNDLDNLIANQSLSPEVVAQLEAAKAALAGVVAFETAQTETLNQLAAKHEQPLPPPVEPPAEPPAEPPTDGQ